MEITPDDIQKMVEQVLVKLERNSLEEKTDISLGDGIFSTVNEAVNAAQEAWGNISIASISKREEMIKSMRDISIRHAEELAQIAVEETGLGRVEDKKEKNLLAARKTPGLEDIVSTSYTGDNGLTLVENAPLGLIGSITPTTNPAATIINNSISMVAAGNAVVFNPHPNAKRVSLKAIQLLNQAIIEAGGPKNLLTAVANPTIETSSEIMNHPQLKALVVTGGGGVVKAAMKTGKKVIAAGPGNPPVVVDETADLQKAAKDIVLGASFDNNVLCTAEKEIFVVETVAHELKQEMLKHDALELNRFQLEKLLKVILLEKGDRFYPNKDFIGKDAHVLLEAAGIQGPPSTTLIFAETPFDHPLVMTEMLMPIIPIVKVPSVDKAIEYAVKAEKGNRHTAIMHSQNVQNLTKMAQKIQATVFVKNGPSVAGLGFGGEGFTTLTIAGPTGEGLTSARTFTRQRRSVLVGGLRII